MPPGLNGRVCICVCLVLTCLHSALVSAICVFQETNEIIFTPCSWSQWMSWNCSRCYNPGPTLGPKFVFRNRGLCCLDTKDLDACLSSCNFTRADGEDQAPCLPHCSNTSHQSSTGAVTILSTGPSTLPSTIPIANLSTEPSQPDPTAKPQMPNHGNTSLGSGHYNGLAAEIETSSNRGASCSFGQWSRIEYLPDTPGMFFLLF
ncbi:hypothetical protein DPMN_066303 [Dreissena polymorpha]|uniref:Uncharacterized protein n=1 Tax=Dreissena polymorpha TaxID=45954 RepID=A0A9D3YV71_DREPO|nr:hypothetical protein DPMN_066303 [Dreissena polymorpha]